MRRWDWPSQEQEAGGSRWVRRRKMVAGHKPEPGGIFHLPW